MLLIEILGETLDDSEISESSDEENEIV